MSNRNVDILVGLQFGDEGKGRVVDYLAKDYSCIARFNGGPNAGHTVFHNGHEDPLKLNMIPSGIVYSDVFNFIGPGCVIDLERLKTEIQLAQVSLGRVITPKRFGISKKAHVILPHHIQEDKERNSHIGTTKRGIGPSYKEKMNRSGIRVEDLFSLGPEDQLGFLYNFVEFADDMFREHLETGKVLCEGAQGTYLDIDHGDYPYVTSSNTLASHACTSLGFGVNKVNDVFGVFKAYTTRVGEGPFFGEWSKESYPDIANIEFGTTTGRQRKIGPLVLADVKKAIELNGVTKLIMTKADVLAGHELSLSIDNSSLSSKTVKFGQIGDANFFSLLSYIEEFLDQDIFLVSSGPRRDDWLLTINA